MDEQQHRAETREQMVTNVRDAIQDQRRYARDLQNTLQGTRSPTDPGNVSPFLAGVQVGLELAAAEVDSLDSEVLYGPREDESDG